MIDNIENIGTFVEFELLYFKPTYSEKELLNKLEKFISNFKEIKLEEAHLPYRDFVAKEIYNKIKSVKAITITEEEIDPIKLKQNECLSLEDEKTTNRILFVLINHIKS